MSDMETFVMPWILLGNNKAILQNQYKKKEEERQFIGLYRKIATFNSKL
jgi:hypothetical protein